MIGWMDQVVSTPEYCPPFSGENQAGIYAVYELCSYFDAGGLVSYFMSDASAYFYQAVAWLQRHGVDHSWVGMVERAFGGEVPPDVERRVDRLSAIEGWDSGVDPFEEAQELFGKVRQTIDDAMVIELGKAEDARTL